VAAYTGFPEMMDGRIKTLHPKIHGGILCRRDNPEDMAAIAAQGIVPFELVVVNLYPFEETIGQVEFTDDEAIEQIDIGGPTLIRAAAKNQAFVTIACKPSHYERILDQIQSDGKTTPELRRLLAEEAFCHTANYDAAISGFFGGWNMSTQWDQWSAFDATEVNEVVADFPAKLTLPLRRAAVLRYGENPHQAAVLYASPDAEPGLLVRAVVSLGVIPAHFWTKTRPPRRLLPGSHGSTEGAALPMQSPDACAAEGSRWFLEKLRAVLSQG
jgi:phosphoribosylaminoimidazolecarboxamide formyltransferase / IMP cyclohydrolase